MRYWEEQQTIECHQTSRWCRRGISQTAGWGGGQIWLTPSQAGWRTQAKLVAYSSKKAISLLLIAMLSRLVEWWFLRKTSSRQTNMIILIYFWNNSTPLCLALLLLNRRYPSKSAISQARRWSIDFSLKNHHSTSLESIAIDNKDIAFLLLYATS